MAPLLLLLLAAGDERLVQDQVEAGAGVGGSAYLAGDTRFGDSLFTAFASGRGHLGPGAAELTVLATTPLTGNTASSVTFAPRVGWTGQSWSVLLGAAIQLSPSTPAPVQALPSLRVDKQLDQVALALGVFDFGGLLPAHLSVSTDRFSFGYVAPVGVRFAFWIPFDRFQLELHAFVYQLLQAQLGMVALSVRFGGGR